MTSKTYRTVSHFHENGDESVIRVNIVTPDSGDEHILLADERTEDLISIHEQQIRPLIRALKSAAEKVWDMDEADFELKPGLKREMI